MLLYISQNYAIVGGEICLEVSAKVYVLKQSISVHGVQLVMHSRLSLSELYNCEECKIFNYQLSLLLDFA